MPDEKEVAHTKPATDGLAIRVQIERLLDAQRGAKGGQAKEEQVIFDAAISLISGVLINLAAIEEHLRSIAHNTAPGAR